MVLLKKNKEVQKQSRNKTIRTISRLELFDLIFNIQGLTTSNYAEPIFISLNQLL